MSLNAADTEEAAPAGRPRSGWRRWRRLLLGLVLVGALLAGATVGGLLWYGNREIGSMDVDTAVPGDTDDDGSVDVPELSRLLNVLVVGSDSREDLSAQERERLGTGQFEGTRTDTIMLMQLDPERKGAAILSFPRDLLVERCDGTQGRINGAYEIGEEGEMGGPTCLVRTVSDLTGVAINHYVQIDFTGFVDVVDALGGVRMCLGKPIVDQDANVDLPAGCQTLSGREALGYVRVRKIDSDFGRIERQQRFLAAVVKQASSPRAALNVPRLFELVDVTADAVEADRGLSLGVMRRIAFSFREAQAGDLDARTVPAFDRTIDGVAYVVADPKPAEKLFAAFRKGVAAPRGVGTKPTSGSTGQ